MYCFGIDTSNYTTSVALFDMLNMNVSHLKKILPVPKGERGLRQSETVFHHTIQLPELIENLFTDFDDQICAIGVSSKPRNEKGSYMPCFLSGLAVAKSIAAILKIPIYFFSHQAGHIAAVLYGAKRLDLLKQSFIAFHVSGGTTEALLITPDEKEIFSIQCIASSLDLKAGQAIDRVGVMLGMQFPAGAEMDRLSKHSKAKFHIKPSMKDMNCCLSGIENKCSALLEKGVLKEDIALYCIDSILITLDAMVQELLKKYGDLPIVFSGGVTSNSEIREYMTKKYHAIFASPELSSDNAVGIAVLTYLMEEKK